MNKLTQRFKNFFRKESSTGILLILATLAALIIANSPLRDFYQQVMQLEFSMGFENVYLSKSIQHWVNDGLMALFFLAMGLEIKSELKFGRLNSFNSAIFPVMAALSGAIFPALIYYGFNYDTPYVKGWAIPMATDIAFVVGIIAILGSRVPTWAKVFVTTIAVVDDLIAVLVIAFFYTENIHWQALGIAGICTLVLLAFNLKKVNKIFPYLAVGFILWWAILSSGIHATVAGVILAFTIPLHHEWKLPRIKEFAKKGFRVFKKARDENFDLTIAQAHYYLEKTQREMESPLKRLERKLHDPVYLVIMPLFAFVNAGIVFNTEVWTQGFQIPLTWGIMFGLFLGKPIGILLMIWIFKKFFYQDMLDKSGVWNVLVGITFLCGIGFTMSIFITNLSFTIEILQEEAKMAILSVSLVSGILGYFLLKRATRNLSVYPKRKVSRKEKSSSSQEES